MSAAESEVTGTVLNIQRYCSHDGPGIRTTVFLKGCSLRCKWCSNPESIHPKPELAYDARLCSGAKECGLCLKAPFPAGAFFVVPGADDKIRVNWDLASDCDEETIALCPTKALYLFGATMTADQVLDEVEKDASFYRTSGGGMTLSGGEATMFPDFATALLVDTVLHDLKVMDPERHKRWTGVDNKRLLENFRKAYETWPKQTFIARRPLIPGVNDDEKDIRAALGFIRPYKNVVDFELLPYMRFGLGKYDMLGRIYELQDFEPPTEESLQHLRAIIDEAFGRGGEEAPGR
jgi:pyruvate formate lyase activating enzyme